MFKVAATKGKNANQPAAQRKERTTERAGARGLQQLQQTMGNQAVSQMLRSLAGWQAMQADSATRKPGAEVARETEGAGPADKPAIAPPNHTDEQAAERAASAFVQNQRPAAEPPARLVIGSHTAVPIPGQNSSTGQPLENSVRRDYERFFHADLSPVRIHTDPGAQLAAESLDAHAFTSGRDIYFGPGEFSPASPGGRRLLAHELTHALQPPAALPLIWRDEKKGTKPHGADAEARVNGVSNRLDEILHVVPDNYDPGILGKLRELNQRVKKIKENFQKGTIPAAEAERAAEKDSERLQGYLAEDPALETLGRMETAFIRSNRSALRSALSHGTTRANDIRDTIEARQQTGTSASFKELGEHTPSSALERDVLEELAIRQSPGGAQQPERFDVGNFGHTYAEQLIKDLPSGLDREVRIFMDDGRVLRADRVQWNDPNDKSKGGTVFEIKPDTAYWQRQGLEQAKNYAKHLSKKWGANFEAVVKFYNRQDVLDLVRDLRAAPGTPATQENPPFLPEPNVRERTPKAPPAEPTGAGETGGSEAPGRTVVPSEPVTPTSVGKPPSPVSARDLLGESERVRSDLRLMTGAAYAAWGYLHYLNIKAHIEEIAKAIDMAAALSAGRSPFQNQIEAADHAETHAKEVQDYFNSLDVTKAMPSAKNPEWDSWYDLNQIQLNYLLLEMKLRESIGRLADAQSDLRKELQDMNDLLVEYEKGMLFPITSVEYAEAILFAEAGGRVNPRLAKAEASYRDAQRAAELEERKAQAAAKTLELRIRQLGGTGRFEDMSIEDIRSAKLEDFTLSR